MTLYHEAGDVLTGPVSGRGGSLKAKIFKAEGAKDKDGEREKRKEGEKMSRVQPVQIYALVLETCKWSAVLKEVIEGAELLKLERKVCGYLPVLSLCRLYGL